MSDPIRNRRRIAVVGTGISGLSAAWLLAKDHDVVVFEQAERVGGHSHTVTVPTAHQAIPVDIGFIVYNEQTYPNLKALFSHLGVATKATDMSLAISMDGGRLEYAGGYAHQLFAQKRNIVRPRFWSMLRDLTRFYREAPADLASLKARDTTLGTYLDTNGYGVAFRDDHLLPMAAAVWSLPAAQVLEMSAHAFIRFQENHGLLRLTRRPLWRTVVGGSQSYVAKLTERLDGSIRTASSVERIVRQTDGVDVYANGACTRFDACIIATHADQALRMIDRPTDAEQSILGTFRYQTNDAVLHSDDQLMPKRSRAWASWNYIGKSGAAEQLMVTYWMNRLQSIDAATPLFVTLNPNVPPDPAKVHHREQFEHPVLDASATAAQAKLWSLQGCDRLWFCGAYFGAGFHEDGLQAGLAVAEAISGRKRPWRVANQSGRIHIASPADRDGDKRVVGDFDATEVATGGVAA